MQGCNISCKSAQDVFGLCCHKNLSEPWAMGRAMRKWERETWWSFIKQKPVTRLVAENKICEIFTGITERS